jgi:alkyldihydroxyacetonephosphate synthase
MRRWNGWGDETIHYPVPARATTFLHGAVGQPSAPRDQTFGEVLASIGASRAPSHPLISADPADRLRHARGQSLPDWIALRGGRIVAFPDAVAYPMTEAEVGELIRYAGASGVRLIPYGGGTSVAGHVNPQPSTAPVVTVDMSRISRLLHLDTASQLATFGAGVAGPDLEAQLRARGYTLGHFPQSFEYSTLGGWIATRSSGQQSLGYGRIEDLFAGGRLISPAGVLDMPRFPASAAGPDLRHLVLGSEGRLGIVVEATVRVRPVPEREDFHAVFLPDWEHGQAAVREIIQARLPLSMLRLSTPVETATTLLLAGHERLIGGLERVLSLRGLREGKCMLLVGFTGRDALVKTARAEALDLAGKRGAVNVGRAFGSQWHRGRFRTPYMRNTLWEMGFAVDTVETATTWTHVATMAESIEAALHQAMAALGERVHVFTHLSHVYPSGSSVYTTFLFRLADDPDETLRRWQVLKSAASEAIVAHGGTISHQHGVGTDHAPYLAAEKGELGMAALVDMCRRFDPDGILNPGKLL